MLQSYLSGTRPGDASAPADSRPTSAPSRPTQPPPAFHVVLDFDGKPLLTFAPGDTKLGDALSLERVEWPYEPLLADEPKANTRRYIWVNGGRGFS